MACTRCHSPAEQVEALQRYVDTSCDEPVESLRPHASIAPDKPQAAAPAGLYITKEQLAETTKSATTNALMAITDNWMNKPDKTRDKQPNGSQQDYNMNNVGQRTTGNNNAYQQNQQRGNYEGNNVTTISEGRRPGLVTIATLKAISWHIAGRE